MLHILAGSVPDFKHIGGSFVQRILSGIALPNE
jgi:hypothetical protein